MSQQVDFYSLGEWYAAGAPLDKSFIVTRGYAGNQRHRKENVFDWSKVALGSVCERVLFSINHYKDKLKVNAFTLVPNTIYNQGGELCFIHLYCGYNFTILVERVGRSLFLEAGAVVTLHSKEQNE